MNHCPVLVMHVNHRCNCRCTMCSIWKSTDTRELTPAALQKLLPDMQALRVESVVLTGGEPLMNAHFTELCRILQHAKVRVTLLTTGLLLDRFASTLPDLVDEVFVSLDGPRDIHDEIRRVRGAFDMLASGVRRLEALPIKGRCTVQRLNCRHLAATVDAAHTIGLHSISFLAADLQSTAFNRETQLSVLQQSDLALSIEEIAALEDQITGLEQNRRQDFATGFIVESPEKLRRIAQHFRAQLGLAECVAPRCNAPWISAVIEHDGNVRPCFFQPAIGNAFDTGLSAAVNSTAAVQFRSDLRVAENSICRRCVCALWRPSAGAPQNTTTDLSRSV